ncbi:MAG: helix-turn-helix domain-containing protein [Bauldia sp.]|nr:helix-turn-helix domain-containing protein [Bauldia sp.]
MDTVRDVTPEASPGSIFGAAHQIGPSVPVRSVSSERGEADRLRRFGSRGSNLVEYQRPCDGTRLSAMRQLWRLSSTADAPKQVASMTMIFLRPAERGAPLRGGRVAGIRPLQDCAECRIRAVSVCSVLDNSELSALEDLGQHATFRLRAILFMEGDRAEAVYNVTAGLVRLFRLLPDGCRQVVGFALPGDFLGLPPDEHHSFSADAAEPTTACRFARQAFSDFVDNKPRLLRRLHDEATRNLGLAHDQMVLLGRRNAEERVASFLIGIRERWARVHGISATIQLPMGRQDIGDFLGLSIATVSRTLNRLARERLILIVPKGVRVLDLPRLHRIAGA